MTLETSPPPHLCFLGTWRDIGIDWSVKEDGDRDESTEGIDVDSMVVNTERCFFDGRFYT